MPDQTRNVILLASDLMLTSSVSGYARSAGLAFHSATSVAQTRDLATRFPSALLLVDLGIYDLDVANLSDGLQPEMLRSAVAYGPHVHTERLAAAEKAGFGKVMSRGQFAAQCGRLLAEFGQH